MTQAERRIYLIRELLASCYRSCLELADQRGVESVAFCCISTGEFHFPNDRAAEIAVRTVREYQTNQNSKIQVIFNVFKDIDYQISRQIERLREALEAAVRAMMERQKDMRIPSSLIPRCPRCGRPLTMNLRADGKFVEDEGWHIAAGRYAGFLRRHEDAAILFLELGVGYNTPVIIKYPLWRMTAGNPKAIYACVNFGEAVCPREIEERSICVDGDIGGVLSSVLKKA